MSLKIVTPLFDSHNLYGELIFMALVNGSGGVFNLCPFAPFCIPQDLMKQGQDVPVINLHFKQY